MMDAVSDADRVTGAAINRGERQIGSATRTVLTIW